MLFLVHLTCRDVTGVMNTCDRHASILLFCKFVHSAVRVCIRLGSLAIAAASACDSFDCEGPPHLSNRPCRLRPTALQRNFAGGDRPYHFIRASRDNCYHLLPLNLCFVVNLEESGGWL